jgi:hypothetical protein
MADTAAAIVDAVSDAIVAAMRPIADRVRDLERRVAEGDAVIVTLRERCAVLETRAPVPGPPGADGKPGADGVNGKDGIMIDDLAAEYDGERTITIKAVGPIDTRTIGVIAMPIPLDRGVWSPTATYTRGDIVTLNGSGWIARKDTTTQPGTNEGGDAWRLFVKRGDRGRDAK